MLAKVAVVGCALLLAVGGIVGGVEVQEDVLGDTFPFSLLQVDVEERQGQAIAGAQVSGVVEA